MTAHFGDVATACRVLLCESGGDPGDVSPTNDHGLFQIHAPLHVESFRQVTGASFYPNVYDPVLNTIYAAWLAEEAPWGGWQHWRCY